MNLISLACPGIAEKLQTLSFNWIQYFFYSSPLAFTVNKSFHYKQKKILLDLITNFLFDFLFKQEETQHSNSQALDRMKQLHQFKFIDMLCFTL